MINEGGESQLKAHSDFGCIEEGQAMVMAVVGKWEEGWRGESLCWWFLASKWA